MDESATSRSRSRSRCHASAASPRRAAGLASECKESTFPAHIGRNIESIEAPPILRKAQKGLGARSIFRA